MLYLFAVAKRKNDIGAELRKITSAAGDADIIIDEVDLCRGSDHDLLDAEVWSKIESQLKDGVYQMVLALPPCNTWSRSTYNPKTGPKPLRSARHLWGSHG